MAIIRPEGLFHGERLSRCSDLAKLYYPFLRLYANGYGRIEIVPTRIIGEVFANFKVKPTEDDLVDVLAEYANNHLLFLYSCGGQFWGQFFCPEHINPKKKSLPRHKNAKDEESPAPPATEYAKWLKEYQQQKEGAKPESVNKLRTLTFAAEPQKVRGEVAAESPRGVGGGEGVSEGGGKNLSAKPTRDDRYEEFVEALSNYWKHVNPPDVKFTMTKKCGKNLKQLLADRPPVVLDRAIFSRCLNNRARSPDTVHSQAVFKWILNVFDYVNGPLDRFGKPHGTSKQGTFTTKQQSIRDKNAESSARLLAAAGASGSNPELLLEGDGRAGKAAVAGTVVEISSGRHSEGAEGVDGES